MTLTRLLTLTATVLLGLAAGQQLERRRLNAETDRLLDITEPLLDLGTCLGQRRELSLGAPVTYVDRDGVSRSARISRVVDDRDGTVDLHVDLPDPNRPVQIITLVPRCPAGASFVHTWHPPLN